MAMSEPLMCMTCSWKRRRHIWVQNRCTTVNGWHTMWKMVFQD